MKIRSKFSNHILKTTSFLFEKKEKIRKYTNTSTLLLNGFVIIISELYLIIISLPSYLLVTEKDLKKEGFDEGKIKSYKLRRKISLSTVSLGILFFLVRFSVLTLTSVWLGKYLGVQAATVNWDFLDQQEYVYSENVQVIEGVAVLNKGEEVESCSGYIYAEDPLRVEDLESWDDFVEIANVGSGAIGYQISIDSANSWLFWNGSSWTSATESDFSTGVELSQNIKSVDIGSSSVLVKAILHGSCEGDVKLLDMGISYSTKKLLVNRWKLDVIDSNVLDSTHVAVVGGVDGNALQFDGISGSYVIPNTSKLSPDQLSLVVWANPTERKTATVIDKGGWKGNYSIYQDKWGGWSTSLKIGGESYKIKSGDDYMTFDEWNLVVVTYDGEQVELSVNGVLANSVSASGQLDKNDFNIYVGSEGNSKKYFNGGIDDLRIYNYALSNEEIGDIYARADKTVSEPEEETPDEEIPQEEIPDGEAPQESSTFNSRFELDENTGSQIVDISNVFTGNTQNTSWVDGVEGSSLEFDGSSYTELNSINEKLSEAIATNGSISFWTQIDGSSRQYLFHSYDNTDNKGLEIYYTNGQLRATFEKWNYRFLLPSSVSGINKADGLWHYIVLNWDRDLGNLYLYVDGEQKGDVVDISKSSWTPTITETTLGTKGLSYPGSGGGVQNPLSGKIEKIYVSETMLTSSEIVATWDEFKGINDIPSSQYPSALEFPFDEGNGIVTLDTTDSATLDLNGSIWTEGIDGYAIFNNRYNDSITSELEFLNPRNSVISFWLNMERNTSQIFSLLDSSGDRVFQVKQSILGTELDSWDNVIISLQNGQSEVYLNGEKIEEAPSTYDVAFVDSLKLSGREALYDELRIINGPLTEELVTSLSTEYQSGKVFDINGEIEGVTFLNENGIPITKTMGFVGLKKNGKSLGNIVINADLSTDILTVDNAEKKTLLHFTDKDNIESIVMALKKTSQDSTIRICPGAIELEEIVSGCPNEIKLSEVEPTDGVYSLIDIEDTEYWYITASVANFSSGAEEFSEGLVAYWSLDTTEEDTIVDQVNGLIATDQGDITYPLGKRYEAALLENVESTYFDDFYSANHSSFLTLGNEGSLCTWVNLHDDMLYQGLLHKGGNGNFSDAEYSLQTFSTGREILLNIVSTTGNDMYVGSSSLLNLDQWYFVCGTYKYDGAETNISIYIDGVLDNTGQHTGAPRTGTGPLQIGAQLIETSTWKGNIYGKFGMNGMLDEVRIYNIEIDLETVQAIMADIHIPEVTLLSPNSGSYVAGTTLDITWESEHTSEEFNLEYSTDGFNAVIETIALDITGSSYAWNLPVGINGSVEVRISNSGDTETFDISDNYIAIADPIPDTMLRWKLDEETGCSVLDDSGIYPGSLGGDSCTSNVPEWSSDGFINSAIAFDNQDYVEIDDAPILNPTNGLTIAAWVKWDIDPTTGEDWAQIINKDNDNQYQIQHNRLNTAFEFAVRTETGRRYIAGDTVPEQGVWYMIVGTYDGSRIQIYVNGALEGSRNLSGNILVDNSPVFLGKRQRGDRNFDGEIDEFRYLNYPLSQSEIAEMYNTDLNRAPSLEVTNVLFDGQVTEIEYTVYDENNDFVSLEQYEYSIDNGSTWNEMTPSNVSGDHSGVAGLPADVDGESYSFVWNTSEDANMQYSDTTLIRLSATDTLLVSELETSSVFEIDCKDPIITDMQVSQISPEGTVSVEYTLEENSLDSVVVSLIASDDLGNSWEVEMNNLTGDVGDFVHDSVLQDYLVSWDVGIDYPGKDSTNLQIKMNISDKWENTKETLSSFFSVDTKSPFGMANFEAIANAEYSALLTWDSVEQESNFDRYQIIYSTSSQNLEDRVSYEEVDDITLENIETNMMVVAQLDHDTTYYFILIARDLYGNATEQPITYMKTLKDIDIENIVLSSNTTRSNSGEVTIMGVSVPNEYITLDIDGDIFEDWVLTDEFGYFEKEILFEEGEYILSVYFQDIARRINSNEIGIAVDMTPPQVSTLVLEDLENNGNVTISGKAEPFMEIILFIDGTLYEIAKITTDNQGLWSQDIFVTENLYESILTVRTRDLVGNSSILSTPVVLPSFKQEVVDDKAISSIAIRDIDLGEIIENSVSSQIFQYRVSRLVDVPEVLSVNQSATLGDINIAGKGIPNSEVVLFVHSEEAFAVKAMVNEDGYWSYTHESENGILEDGEHEVYAITVDDDGGVRSKISNIFKFSVNITPLIIALGYIDIPTTVVALVILGFALFLVMYSRNKFKGKTHGSKE